MAVRAYGFYRHRGWLDWKTQGGLCWEGRDLWRTHVSRMSLAVKENEALNPLEILLLRAIAAMQRAPLVPRLVEQTGRAVERGRSFIRIHAA